MITIGGPHNSDLIAKTFTAYNADELLHQAEKYAKDNNLKIKTTFEDIRKFYDGIPYKAYVKQSYIVLFTKEENNMNNETITITRNGKTYEVDFEKAEELGVLKEKVKYPKSWEDYKQYYLETDTPKDCCLRYSPRLTDIHDIVTVFSFKTHDEVDAFVAFGKLIQLRDWWWDNMCDGWRPGGLVDTYIIMRTINDAGIGIIDTDESWGDSYTLSFPTEDIRDKFLETYNDLIIEAKMFL